MKAKAEEFMKQMGVGPETDLTIGMILFYMEQYTRHIATEFAEYYFTHRGLMRGNTKECFDEWKSKH